MFGIILEREMRVLDCNVLNNFINTCTIKFHSIVSASIHSAATPVGSFASGWIMEHFGRRNCLRSTVVPFIIGWLTLAFAENHPLILFGRFCTGFAVGLSGPSCQVLSNLKNILNK